MDDDNADDPAEKPQGIPDGGKDDGSQYENSVNESRNHQSILDGEASDEDAEPRAGLGSSRAQKPDWRDDIALSAEDEELLRKKQHLAIINDKVANYVWGQDVKNLFTFPDLQRAKPLKGRQRAEIIRGHPDLSTGCPCAGLKGMGEEEVNLPYADRWFCDTAAPHLHKNIVEEMAVLAWIIQEAMHPEDVEGEPGTRVGLSEQGIFALLKKLVGL